MTMPGPTSQRIDPYRAAVVGLGNIGFLFDLDARREKTWSHTSAYLKCPETELVAAVEPDPGKTALFAERHPNVPVYPDLDGLFSNHAPDLVSICTPTSTHRGLLEAVLSRPVRGVFCEKPFGRDAAECRDMLALADRAKAVIAVNHTRRWESSFIRAAELIAGGGIGAVRAMHAYYPGQIYNIGTHLYDALRMLAGSDPRAVGGFLTGPECDDPSVSGMMLFDVFQCAIQATGKREDLVFEVDVIGDRGRLKIVENGYVLELFRFEDSPRYSGYRELVPVPVPELEDNDRFLDAVRDIVQAMDRPGRRVKCSAEDGYYAVHIAEEFLASARAGGQYRTLTAPDRSRG